MGRFGFSVWNLLTSNPRVSRLHSTVFCFLVSVPIHSDDDGGGLRDVQLVVLLDVVHCDNVEQE